MPVRLGKSLIWGKAIDQGRETLNMSGRLIDVTMGIRLDWGELDTIGNVVELLGRGSYRNLSG